MLKKLMLVLFLSLVMSGTAAPILHSYFGIGSTAAYAAEDDSQGNEDGDQDNNDQN